ncbi:MAG TPA: hypothetical protein VFO55_11845 [Gemmatimonadaceae bacterium]|nr:hypothetical protein [Gemmatimonadaceae bacterium]
MLAASILCLGAVANAQLPPVRPLGPVVATTTESFGSVPSVRALSDGRVLVSDMTRRRLVAFDSMLAKSQPVLNPSGPAASQFPARGGLLLAMPGDTTLVFDAASASFVVLDGAGQVARVISVPRASDAFIMSSPQNGIPVIDNRMRMIYRTRMRPQGFSRATGNPIYPDSAPVIAVSFDTRQADTLAWMKIPPFTPSVSGRDPDGRMRITSVQPPFELTDEWAALHDGTIAIIRWRDYHVDWVTPDGRKESSPRTAWNWVRMSDEDKSRFIDTLKAVYQKNDSTSQSQMMMFGGGPSNMPIFETLTVAPSEVPDYPPPFVPRATRVDPDGRIWLLERANLGSKAPLVYDVIDRTGQIVDRVQMPPNAAVIGFGPGGSVYLSITPANNTLAASMPQPVNPVGPGGGGPPASVKVARAILPKK